MLNLNLSGETRNSNFNAMGKTHNFDLNTSTYPQGTVKFKTYRNLDCIYNFIARYNFDLRR